MLPHPGHKRGTTSEIALPCGTWEVAGRSRSYSIVSTVRISFLSRFDPTTNCDGRMCQIRMMYRLIAAESARRYAGKISSVA
jgi:hypothetical protein